MPRLPRLNLPGLYYHVIVRGLERRDIFRRTGDYLDFLARLSENLVASGCRCFAFALMPNHIHLLILSGVRGLVRLMHPLLTGYAVTFNLKYRRVGHLFQNRYKSILCQEDAYFLELVRYIGLNHVRAGIVKTPQELANYPWSSYSAMRGRFDRPWLEREEVLGRFGSTVSAGLEGYDRYIQEGWNQGHQDRLEGGGLVRSLGGLGNVLQAQSAGERHTADLRILGDSAFVEEILQQAEEEERQHQSINEQWSKESLCATLSDRTGISPERLLSTDRTRTVSDARAMLVFAATEYLGMESVEAREWTHLSAAGITRARQRGRELAEKKALREWLRGRF